MEPGRRCIASTTSSQLWFVSDMPVVCFAFYFCSFFAGNQWRIIVKKMKGSRSALACKLRSRLLHTKNERAQVTFSCFYFCFDFCFDFCFCFVFVFAFAFAFYFYFCFYLNFFRSRVKTIVKNPSAASAIANPLCAR